MSFSAKPSKDGKWIMVSGIYAVTPMPLTIEQAADLAAELNKAVAATRNTGKPNCKFCQGRGFVVYIAGGSTREDRCGCIEKP